MAHLNRRLSEVRAMDVDRRPSFKPPPPRSPTSNVQPRPRPSVLDEEPIPRVNNVAPCVFVPLETDITKPRDPPRDRVEKLERRITAANVQRRGVLENLAYLAEQEKRSIQQYSRQKEAVTGPPQEPNPGLPPQEVDWIMENMAAPAPKNGQRLNVKSDDDMRQLLERVAQGVPPPERGPTLRETAARELLEDVTRAAHIMKYYNIEVDKRIHVYSLMLEKEKRLLEEAGKRPEQRHGTY